MKVKHFYSKPSDLAYIKRAVSEKCKELDFNIDSFLELELTIIEALSNVDKHGGGQAEISLYDWIENEENIGILVKIKDFGPGISDFSKAVRDGISTAGSLGIGLGSIHRLSDEVSFENVHSQSGILGNQIIIKKRKDESRKTLDRMPILNLDLNNWKIAGDIKKTHLHNSLELFWMDRDPWITIIMIDSVELNTKDKINGSKMDKVIKGIRIKTEQELISDNTTSVIREVYGPNTEYNVVKINKETKKIIIKGKGDFRRFLLMNNEILEYQNDSTDKFSSELNLTSKFTLICISRGISRKWTNLANIHEISMNSLFELNRTILKYRKDDANVAIISVSNW